MPGFSKIPEEIREEYIVLNRSAKSVKQALESLDIEREEILENALKEINIKKAGLVDRLNKLERAMEALHPKEPKGYKIDAGWKEKILWVLNASNRLLPVATIVAKIRDIENDFDTALNPIIRLTMKRMQDKGEIIKYEEPNPGTIHYGLPEWFINGKLIDAYHYLM